MDFQVFSGEQKNSMLTSNMNYTSAMDPNASLSNEQLLELLLQDGMEIKPFDNVTQLIFIVCFAMLILVGAVGNGLVCYVVAKNPHMRTPRNIFIINLAISDLTLCLFTQPINLYKILRNQWILGEFMCKFVPMFQGTNVFVSTISITAIALDRFQVIVYPTKDSMKKIGAAAALISIWIISFLMASPLIIFSVHSPINPVNEVKSYFYYMCFEDVTLQEEKGAYSVASIIVQYILPIFIVTIAHLRICNKLKYRMVNQQGTGTTRKSYQTRKSKRQNRRNQRTNILLATIAVIFALSWLPLNIFNILTDFNIYLFSGTINVNLVYIICHMLVLSSACTNPLLYGWLNENFRNEFLKILCCNCCAHLKLIIFRHLGRESRDNVVIVMTKSHNASTQYDKDGYSVTGASTVNINKINTHVSL